MLEILKERLHLDEWGHNPHLPTLPHDSWKSWTEVETRGRVPVNTAINTSGSKEDGKNFLAFCAQAHMLMLLTYLLHGAESFFRS